MIQSAFKMNLTSGNIEEYKKRHDTIDPAVAQALHDAGIRNYSIFYDPETKILFALWHMLEDHTADDLPNNPAIRKWWDYMNDGIMEYNEKNEPVAVTLENVFHMD